MLVRAERENGTLRVSTVISGESMTEQSHRQEVNINTIVARARKGILPRGTGVMPNYGDFSSGMDYHEAQNKIVDAKRDFMRMPADIRKRFGNDPANMIDFLGNPDNREEAEELGLIAPKVEVGLGTDPETKDVEPTTEEPE